MIVLFRKTSEVLADRKENALAKAHSRMTVFSVMELIVYAVCFVFIFVVKEEGFLKSFAAVLSKLDMLLWVFIVWYGGINQMRASWRLG